MSRAGCEAAQAEHNRCSARHPDSSPDAPQVTLGWAWADRQSYAAFAAEADQAPASIKPALQVGMGALLPLHDRACCMLAGSGPATLAVF